MKIFFYAIFFQFFSPEKSWTKNDKAPKGRRERERPRVSCRPRGREWRRSWGILQKRQVALFKHYLSLICIPSFSSLYFIERCWQRKSFCFVFTRRTLRLISMKVPLKHLICNALNNKLICFLFRFSDSHPVRRVGRLEWRFAHTTKPRGPPRPGSLSWTNYDPQDTQFSFLISMSNLLSILSALLISRI